MCLGVRMISGLCPDPKVCLGVRMISGLCPDPKVPYIVDRKNVVENPFEMIK